MSISLVFIGCTDATSIMPKKEVKEPKKNKEIKEAKKVKELKEIKEPKKIKESNISPACRSDELAPLMVCGKYVIVKGKLNRSNNLERLNKGTMYMSQSLNKEKNKNLIDKNVLISGKCTSDVIRGKFVMIYLNDTKLLQVLDDKKIDKSAMIKVCEELKETKSANNNKEKKERIVFPWMGEFGEPTYWSTDFSDKGTFELKKLDKKLGDSFEVNNGSNNLSSLYFNNKYYFYNDRTSAFYESDGTNKGTKVFHKMDKDTFIDRVFSLDKKICYLSEKNNYCLSNKKFTTISKYIKERKSLYELEKNNQNILRGSTLYGKDYDYYYVSKDGYIYVNNQGINKKLTHKPLFDNKTLKNAKIKLLKVIDSNRILYSVSTVIKRNSCREMGLNQLKLYLIKLKEDKKTKIKEIEYIPPRLLC